MLAAPAHIQTLIHSTLKRRSGHVGSDQRGVMRTQTSALHRKADGPITERNATVEPWMEASVCSLQTGESSRLASLRRPGGVKLLRPRLHGLDTYQQTKRFCYHHLNMEMKLNELGVYS